eukprot:10265780-Lingulodinium_polyedra.AAC.1
MRNAECAQFRPMPACFASCASAPRRPHPRARSHQSTACMVVQPFFALLAAIALQCVPMSRTIRRSEFCTIAAWLAEGGEGGRKRRRRRSREQNTSNRS